jgi:hypothetical protein
VLGKKVRAQNLGVLELFHVLAGVHLKLEGDPDQKDLHPDLLN